MSAAEHCFDLLFATELKAELPPVVAAFGDDAFLRRRTTLQLLKLSGIDEQEARAFEGDECVWRDVHDELATVSLFDPDQRRVALVKNADDLVKASRPQMEKWASSPVPSSLLLLELSTFPSNTKLYKIVNEKGRLIDCSAPKGKTAEAWIKQWASTQYQLTLTSAQTGFILDRVGNEYGLLDQELAKASLYAGDKGKITDDQLKLAIGSWRTQTVWEIVAAAAEGRTAEALEQLHRVLLAGEVPHAIAPQMSWSLRRYATAAHLVAQAERAHKRLPLRDALMHAGFRPFEVGKAEEQLRRIGRHRGLALLDWLLELDLKIKGSHAHDDRAALAIEELIVRLAGE